MSERIVLDEKCHHANYRRLNTSFSIVIGKPIKTLSGKDTSLKVPVVSVAYSLYTRLAVSWNKSVRSELLNPDVNFLNEFHKTA